MIKKFKSMPTDVKLAIAFLVILATVICYLIPIFTFVLFTLLGLAFSIARIISYFVDEE